MRIRKTQFLCLAIPILLLLFFQPSRVSAKPLGNRILLENGITLLVSERPGVPFIVVEALIKAGSTNEPSEKAGLANLTAELLTQGTTKRRAEEIARETDFMGASLSASSDYDFTEVELVILKKYLDKGLEILGDVLTNPSFPQEEVEKKVREIEGELKKNEEDPDWVAEREFLKALFKDHPYGRMVEGNKESLKRIKRDDIEDFHSNYYLPNRTIIAVAGDLTFEEAKNLIEKKLGNWQPKEIKEKEIPPPPTPEKTVSLELDRKVAQANIILGHLGITRDNPDYYAVQVMNYILGGGNFSSRLVNDIRDKMGLAYSVSSEYIARKHSGYFQIGLQTKNPSAKDAIKLVIEDMKRIREDGVSDKELEDAKAYLVGSLPLRIETNKEVAKNMELLEFYGLGLDYFDRYTERIKDVTKEDVLRAAKKYLHPERYVLVTVANLKEANIR